MTVQIKICGITTRSDAESASALGAAYLGLIVNIAGSRRSVSTEKAAEICPGIPRPVLLMEGTVKIIEPAIRQIKPYAVQLIGTYAPGDIKILKEETGVKIWQSFHVSRSGDKDDNDYVRQIDALNSSPIDTVVVDTLIPGHKGGTGRTCNWETAAAIVRSCKMNVFLAGGLTPENVAQAISLVKPFGVDVSSGVENSPGHKDLEKISVFIQKANTA